MRLKQIALATLFGAAMALPALAQTPAAPATTTPATPAKPAVTAPATSAPATAAPAPAAAATAKPTTPAAKTTATKTTKSTTAIVNINTATSAELQTVKGIGKAHAAAIIKGRPYKSVDDIDTKKVLSHGEYTKLKGQFTL